MVDMEVPRHWRLNNFRGSFSVTATKGKYSGLPILVTEAPRPILEPLGLTPEVIVANRLVEEQAKQLALAVPIMLVVANIVE